MAIQDKFNRANVIYKITRDVDLGGDTLTIPEGCTLDFQGGSFNNGTLKGNNTAIQASLTKIFGLNIELTGNWNISETYPEWYGAKGDGVTNDTACLQKCLDLKMPVFLSKKTYLITKTLIAYKDIVGENSSFSTIIYNEKFTSENYAIVYSSVENVNVRNICILGNKASTSKYTYGGGLLFNNSKFITITNCFFRHIWGHGVCIANDSTSFTISNNKVFDCFGDGICIFAGCSNGTITSNQIENCSYGVELEGRNEASIIPVTNVSIASNVIHGGTFKDGVANNNNNGSVGILLIGANNCTINGNSIEQFVDYGIKCIASKNSVISSNSIKNIHNAGANDIHAYSSGVGIGLLKEEFNHENSNIQIAANNISYCRVGIQNKGEEDSNIFWTPNSTSYVDGVLNCVFSNGTNAFNIGDIIAVEVTNQVIVAAKIVGKTENSISVLSPMDGVSRIVKCSTYINVVNNNIDNCKHGTHIIKSYWLGYSNNSISNEEGNILERCLLCTEQNNALFDSGWRQCGSYNADIVIDTPMIFDVFSSNNDIKVLFRDASQYMFYYNVPYILKVNTDSRQIIINVSPIENVSVNNLYFKVVI